MSTLRVNTIQNVAGSGSPDVAGTAKAWVNFNGTGTVAIRASLNVSSITDVGTGQYTINFTNTFADANYACVLSVKDDTGSAPSISFGYTANIYSTTQVSIAPWTYTGSRYDSSIITAAVFR
jgi:hypothetical protein